MLGENETISPLCSKLGPGHLKMKFLSISLNKFIYGRGYTLAIVSFLVRFFVGLLYNFHIIFHFFCAVKECSEMYPQLPHTLTDLWMLPLLLRWAHHKKRVAIFIFYWRDTLIFVITMTLRWWAVIFIPATCPYVSKRLHFFRRSYYVLHRWVDLGI